MTVMPEYNQGICKKKNEKVLLRTWSLLKDEGKKKKN